MTKETNTPRLSLQGLEKKQRPISKQIRPMIPEIEEKISDGYLLTDIVEELNKQDVDITLRNLNQILYRHRKKIAAQDDNDREQQPEKDNVQKLDGDPVKSEAPTTSSKQGNEDKAQKSLDDILKRQRENDYSPPPRRSKLLGGGK
jgi:hypothetical protein